MWSSILVLFPVILFLNFLQSSPTCFLGRYALSARHMSIYIHKFPANVLLHCNRFDLHLHTWPGKLTAKTTIELLLMENHSTFLACDRTLCEHDGICALSSDSHALVCYWAPDTREHHLVILCHHLTQSNFRRRSGCCRK